MTTIRDELHYRWSSRIGTHRRADRCRPYAALSYLVNGGLTETFVDAHRLLLVLLFDEAIGHRMPALRLVGYGSSACEHGHSWGGAENARFYKDLSIRPAFGAKGLQLDSSKTELFKLGLQLQADLHRVDRYLPKCAVRPCPELPRLWAGFRSSDAAELVGEGPEFELLCKKFDFEPAVMLHKFERRVHSLHFFPLDWVGPLHKSLATFADLEGFPKRQVFRLDEFPNALMGFQGATMWDFFQCAMRDRFDERLRTKFSNTDAALAAISSVA